MSGARSPAEVLALLEAAGRQMARGEAVDLVPVAPADIAAALRTESFDLSVLEQAAVRVVSLSGADLDDVGDDASETLREALAPCDAVMHVLLAAERMTGRPPALSAEQEGFVVELEELVRPCLHRLTAWNELRGEMASAIVPGLRARFWWWCEGAGIAPSAATSLAVVAELVARFPAAQRELDALVGAARAMRAAAPVARAAAPVTTLAEWAKRKRHGADAATGELRVAAASGEQRIDVARAADYDVMWRHPASVVVDVHVEPPAGTTPSVRTASGRVLAMVLVPRTIHRYVIELDDEALGEERIVVVVPLASGDVEIVVPPREVV